MKWRHAGIIAAITLFGALVVLSVFIFETNEKGEYDFVHPDKTYILSDSLREVSGVCLFNKKLLACVEDEHGIVYLFDLEEGRIKRKIQLATSGDFEGVARAGKELYLLRSDGTLFMRSTKKQQKKVTRFRLQLPGENYEGLFYDKKQRRLLIVSRAPEPDERGIPVYAFSVPDKQLKKEPVIWLQPENDVLKATFSPSDLAIHPQSGNLYVLSASNHTLCVFDTLGAPVYTQQLNPVMYNKPEGLAFAKNGDLYIANEAQTEKPTIYRLVYLR